ncbi:MULTISPECIES: acetolactate synthase small subunit [Empedobacter]|uniref:Acetolactate synthase small subunit n=1 Tax=Empedobacter falsenii TaxID=343874 RepID=A0A376J6B2_9FLAO|nr:MULTISPECIES: acetolactate synthase small subunit [Empedobacter]HAR71816.1 acetolactate synthase small subunit [Flavobacteriaceae bacterium]MBW1618617.1 acetolactate synthase small subunit [Empedobacter falsenii]MDH1882082.1 acetolactate synthase small subunit [Empedobacter sp. GD03797]MDM1552465.1 acetolactate synthase small subunit [Empedobacter falsenii]STE54864.1 Acetolactate synthase small subunit [Empedobacter falsenii]
MDSKQEYTITLYTENSIGILGRVAGIFTRRKINIESLSTSPSEIENVHRFTIVIEESEEVVRKLCMQIEKQIDVLKAYFNNNDELIWQEQALYKVPTNIIAEKAYVERLLRQYGANTVVIRNDYTVFETAGHREEIDNLTQELTKYGLIEFVRGARIAIIKASAGFHEKLLQFEKDEPSKEVIENEFLNEGNSVFTM